MSVYLGYPRFTFFRILNQLIFCYEIFLPCSTHSLDHVSMVKKNVFCSRTIHLDMIVVACGICKRTFNQRSALSRHIKEGIQVFGFNKFFCLYKLIFRAGFRMLSCIPRPDPCTSPYISRSIMEIFRRRLVLI